MRTSTLLLVSGLLGALLASPAVAQERGPRFERRALPQEPAQRPAPRAGTERPLLEGLRTHLLERFDANGDGRLDDAERQAARKAWSERRGAPQGERRDADSAPPRADEGARRGPARGAQPPGRRDPHQRPARPLLEKLIERARELPPHERQLLRRRLAERFGEAPAPHGPHRPQAGQRPFQRFEPQRPQPQRRGPDAQRGPQRRGPGFGAPERPRRPAPAPQRRQA